MGEMRMIPAVNRALQQEMARDDRVTVLGNDIGEMGDVFGATEGLLDRFGEDRVIEMPLSENALLGTVTGMAMRGDRPVAVIPFMGFLYPAFEQFMYSVAHMHHRSEGRYDVPVTVRMAYGGGIGAGVYHSETTESLLVHTPGVRVVCPGSPAEAKGLNAAAIRSDDPVVVLEAKPLYFQGPEPVDEEPYTVPLDEARPVRRGDDVTVLTWGAMVPEAVAAAREVDASVDLIDMRSLWPLDIETVLDSVRRTGRVVVAHEARRTLGVGSELVSLVTEEAFGDLEAPPRRVTGFDVHHPLPSIEDVSRPDAARIRDGITAVMEGKGEDI